MASNHNHQLNAERSMELNSQSNRGLMQQATDDIQYLEGTRLEPFKKDNKFALSGHQSCEMTRFSIGKYGDVQLLKDRQIRFNQRERRQLERLCEEKVSKHKLEEVHSSLPSSIKSTFIMTFSPDGQRVASTHGDHRIYICDLNTGKLLDTLEGHPKTPWCLAWHPSNREILASGCLAGEVRVWDLRSKACESWTSETQSIITSLDFHPKERVLVIATANDVLFWDWGESEPFAKTTTMHEREKVKFVAFDSSGTKLITGISNLPKYAGYSNDSLQNRIIDGYLSQGPIETLPTENMTQNSEIAANPATGMAVNANETQVRQNANSATQGVEARPTAFNGNTDGTTVRYDLQINDHDINNRNTLLLSRIASLYRQLESLEDSLRHTSFAPFMNLRPVDSPSYTGHSNDDNSGSVDRNFQSANGFNNDSSRNPSDHQQASNAVGANQYSPPTNEVPSQNRHESNPHPLPATPLANTFELYLVTFDEFLEQLHLPVLIMDGRSVDLATVIDQYPVDLSRQVHHAMQFESINQVNQNFIRISKLMSSARLYRQVVQQIFLHSAGNRPYQPNQILSAQSVSPRSPRHSPNIPIVLRNYSLGNSSEPGEALRQHYQTRTHDPIMAIEFRNTARNVPLTTICKIDLLAARAICILRSQNLVEQALANARSLISEGPRNQEVTQQRSDSLSAERATSANDGEMSIQSILSNLHSTLTTINHAPLTTSNAYTHITSLRVVLERLHNVLMAMLRSPTDGKRLIDLMHNIAYSLTGRRWSVPLGATLNDIRLDVIHTLCIVDLTLHFVRQTQLLQMTRVSLIARVDESRRPNPVVDSTASSLTSTTEFDTVSASNQSPSASSPSGSRLSGASKRKNSESSRCEVKRVRTNSSQSNTNSELAIDNEEARLNQTQDTSGATSVPITYTMNNNTSPSADRMVIWNSPQSQIDQSLQRFLVATTSSTSHILVRVYHRLHGMPTYPAVTDPLLERAIPQVESRRRALSQDNSIDHQDPIDASPSAGNTSTQPRYRVRPPISYQVNELPHGSNQNHSSAGSQPFDLWQRHPHVHLYQTRGPGQHLWFNQWTTPLPMNNSNFRLQCWNFTRSLVPNIKDSQLNVLTHKCRLHNESSVDLSSDGSLLGCLVPHEDGHTCFPGFDLKIFSLKTHDFGSCYFKLLQGHNPITVSLSPSGNYAVVGLATHKSVNYDQNDDDLKIGKVFRLTGNNSIELIRDIKIKRDDSSYCLNAIKWMPRGIVYSVGPQHIQRYQTARMRNVVAS